MRDLSEPELQISEIRLQPELRTLHVRGPRLCPLYSTVGISVVCVVALYVTQRVCYGLLHTQLKVP